MPVTYYKLYTKMYWYFCSVINKFALFMIRSSIIFEIAVVAVESAVKYFSVLKGIQTTQKGQYHAELTLLPRLCVKLLITAITAVQYLVHPQTTITALGVTGTSTTISRVVSHT